jgi:hypothetical protein
MGRCAHLDTLYRLDLIDDAERRERQELADAAYAHAIETALSSGSRRSNALEI